METVLVVDDEPLVLMALVDYLVSDGFAVLEAGNADRALVMLENNPGITAIFTDLQMPGSMNGLELARQVNLRSPGIRVVVIWGNATFGAGDLAQADGCVTNPTDTKTSLAPCALTRQRLVVRGAGRLRA